MNDSIILGISGHKQSGKSTLAEYLTRHFEAAEHERYASTYSFADALKNFCINTLGLSKEQCYGTDEQKNTVTKYLWDNIPMDIRMKYSNQKERRSHVELLEFGGQKNVSQEYNLPRSGIMTGREVMQVFGSDIMRNYFSDMIWVNGTISQIKKDKSQVSIVADVRFTSEVNAILEQSNGYIVRLTREIDPSDRHISEIELDNYDWVAHKHRCLIINNKDEDINYKNKLALEFISSVLR